MTTLNVINHTNNKIANWFKNSKTDFNVTGEGVASIENDQFVINYEEDGVEKKWSTAFYPEYLEFNKDYFFNVWMEEAN